MLDPTEVLAKPFRDSHLFKELQKLLILGRIWEAVSEPRSVVYSLGAFDLVGNAVQAQVEEDYEVIRETIRDRGFSALSGTMGQ